VRTNAKEFHLCDGDIVIADVKVWGVFSPLVKVLVWLKLCGLRADIKVYWSYSKAMEDYE